MQISASLVLFNNPVPQLQCLLSSVENSSLPIHLIVQDNSPTPILSRLFRQHEYHHVGYNIGFGAAHNRAITSLSSDYHLILNPDIQFQPDTLCNMIAPMQQDASIVACSPLVHYPDGQLQRLNKLLPTPANLFARRFFPFLAKHLDFEYEMQWFGYDRQIDLPCASGCFLVVKTDILKKINGFDERFFMYLEDTDLSRRITQHGRITFTPEALVTHEFGKASYKNKKLLLIHIQSAIRYFNKWGWFFDKDRELRNEKARLQRIQP
ncbi:glycosyltransferase family 2 protein (plasmid) [Chromobacterium amazonense]|uniref:glycosyltransferase family 2 protein n=1 Tax=Chromobacterium amazonense TaxID=1382803 RepID=UPI00237EE934|nr:glycosyltransferase family 2 protein [Chromobacterium amazonense]MDE1713181.1 glycosyltransferase family 2 protein [Chromobacterium amazonense]